jgi:glycosyltransferase involved in cell wall biosynthesis
MSIRKQVVTVIIPCYNEGKSIKKVIRDFNKSELTKEIFDFDILVVDNNSKDDTALMAQEAGARIIIETRQGKGFAMRSGFANIAPNAKYVVMLDGDDTYRPEEVLRMLEPLHHKFCDAVVGSRLSGKIHGDGMTKLHLGGNWFFTFIVRNFYPANVTDVLSGYFAWKREVIDNLAPNLKSHGFAVEMEMITKMARLGYDIYSVPISYHHRAGESSLKPFGDGLKILKMFLKNLRWENPEAIEAKVEIEKLEKLTEVQA